MNAVIPNASDALPYRDPFFSLRRPSRSILSRFLAHLLVRLLIVSTLPANFQAATALFPISMLWPLVTPEESDATSAACFPETRVRGFEQKTASHVGSEGPQAAESHQGFGLAYDGIASEWIVFTGYQWDRETGLYHAKARFYSPEIGRFISQDTFLGNVDDPPSLHRYFYANANPTRYIDLTGHQAAVAEANLFARNRSLWFELKKQQIKEALKEFDRQVERGIEISLINLFKALNSPGHMPPEKAAEYYTQPETTTEKVVSDITDIALILAPLGVRRPVARQLAVAEERTTLSAMERAAIERELAVAESGMSQGQKAAIIRESSRGKGSAPLPVEGALADAGSATDAAVKKAPLQTQTGSNEALYARGSFRKSSVDTVTREVPRNMAGEMTCPTCEKIMPEKIVRQTKRGPVERRGFDIDHFNKTWAQRVKEMKEEAAATGREPSRNEVLDEYNRLLRAQCPECNQGHQFEGPTSVVTQPSPLPLEQPKSTTSQSE